LLLERGFSYATHRGPGSRGLGGVLIVERRTELMGLLLAHEP
jgi:hypothetical protein